MSKGKKEKQETKEEEKGINKLVMVGRVIPSVTQLELSNRWIY